MVPAPLMASPCLDEATFMDLLLGSLAPGRRVQVDDHLDSCTSCRRMVADALKVHSSSEDVPRVAPRPTDSLLGSQLSAQDPGPRPSATGPDVLLERGTAVGRYLVLERLGSGAMGVVYSAYDPELDRRIALKLLRVGVLGLDPEASRAHLLHEAQAMARVSHPHVVPIYDVGTFGEQVFLAMEHVEAQTLRGWLAEAPRPWRQVRDVFLQAGRGLAAAHASGIVHGDVKPENILVGRDGRVRVTDFGLSRTSKSATAPKRSRQPSGGTPAYMAPEQFSPEGHSDPRSDQFSLCVALYEALYGERPFAGTTLEELSAEVLTGRVRPVPKGSSVPPWLRRVVLRGLCTAAVDRYPTQEALLAAMQADPAVRWKRRLTLGAALGLVVGAVAVPILYSHQGWVCAGAGDALESVWGPQRKQEVQTAFYLTGKPFAEDAWRGVQRTLDAYTAAWVTTRTAACEATRVRGEQSEEVMALRMRCLDQRLAEVAALSRLFSQADAQVVEWAARAVEGLPPLAGCSDVAALAARGPQPVDPAARERAEALRDTLAQGRAMLAAARYTPALELVEPVARAAKEAGDGAGAAEALLLVARLRERAGDLRGARTVLFEALRHAELSRNDEAAAHIWTMAVRTVDDSREQQALAEHWRERAEVAIERLGRGAEALLAELDTSVARNLYMRGRYSEAAERHEAAIARLERAQGPRSLEGVDARVELGTVRLAQGRVEEAITLFEQALEARRQLLGADHPEVARVIQKLGQARLQQGRREEAEAHLRQALAVFERALGPEHPRVAEALHSLGNRLVAAKRPQEAVALLERALRITEKVEGPESTQHAVLLNSLAMALSQQKRVAEARALYETSLARVEKNLGPEHPTVCIILRGLGRTYFEEKRYTEALKYYQRVARIQGAQQDDVFGWWTGSLMDLAEVYLALGRPRDALVPLEKALTGWERARPRMNEAAALRFQLAEALWESDVDRPRAVRMATEAREMARQRGHAARHLLSMVEGWLTARRKEFPQLFLTAEVSPRRGPARSPRPKSSAGR